MIITWCQELVFLSVTGGSKREERRWKIITGVGGHPQAEQMKMLSRLDKRYGAIAVLLLEWQQMSWVWIVRGYGGSLRKIWGWGRSVQKWYQGCWMKDKRSGVCKCVKAFWSNSKLNPTCWKELLLAMSHGSSSTIHSPDGRTLNGRVHCHQNPKRRGCSKPRWLLIAIFDVHEIVHAEFLPQGQTINQRPNYNKNILRHLMRLVREKRKEKKRTWETRSWLLQHDNAPAHNASGIWEFLAKNNIAVLEQPPYSLADLAPCDFFLFPKLKEVIKGTRFQTSEAITTVVTRELQAIPK